MTVYVYSLDNPEVNNPYSTEDYGSISTVSASSEDIGAVSDANPTFNFTEDDWYSITISESLIAYGSIGTLNTSQLSASYNYTSSGILFEFTTQTITENIVFTWVGNGTVFEIGNGLERTVNAYLSSGTLRLDTTVAETALESITISPVGDTTLYTITGNYTGLQFIAQIPENTQLFSISGVAIENDTESYVGSGNIQIFGSAEESFVTANYTGSGTLFSLDTAEESITYDYNEFSIEAGFVDYGSIIDLSDELPGDYGQVSETPNPQIGDYAFIVDSVTPVVYPFGGMSLSGSAICSANYRLYIDGTAIVRASYSEVVSGSIILSTSALESETESYVGVGTLTFSGTSLEAFSAQTPEDTQLFSISGVAVESETESYVGVGTLTLSGTALEIDVDSYPPNTQLFSISGVAVESETESYVGVGTATFSGTALEAYSAQTPEDFVLYTFSGVAIESYSANPPENTQLFSISGLAVEKNTESYVGIGTLFEFGQLVESVTYDYNESSIIEGALDYGLIIHNPTEQPADYGNVYLSPTGLTLDFGEVSAVVPSLIGELVYPFGQINVVNGFSPQDTEAYPGGPGVGKSWSFTRKGYIGDTALYSISGIASCQEIAVYQDFVTSGLFTITNTSIIHPFVDYTPHYGIEKNIGIGTTGIQISGELLHPNIDYTPHYGIEKNIGIGTTGIQISGTALEAYSAQTPEDLVLYTFSGTALEAYSAQTPEDFVLYTFSGVAVEKNTESYVGLGTLTFSGVAIEKDVDSYVGLGTLTFSGIAIEKDVDSYVGLGNLTLSGTALEAYSAQTPENTQLFSISGVALEAYSAQIPENTQLFTISGTALEAYSAQTPEDFVLYTFSGVAVEKDVDSYVGLGTLTFSGIAIEKDVDSYVGLGTLTFSGTALEAYSAQTPENTQLFSISGVALEAYSAQTPENTQLFSISGELLHPNIDYTPHYGIEKNIGIGTTGIKFGIGVGTAPDSEGNLRDAKTYSNRYPINDKVPGTGIGTFTFDQTNNTAKYSPLTPYSGTGLFNVITGFSPQDTEAYPGGPGVGKSWSFARSSYITSGIVTIPGNALTRPVRTFTYSGSGNATISQQTTPTLERQTDNYKGSGSITLSAGADKIIRKILINGKGTLFVISGISETLESISAQIPDNTVLYQFTSSASESLSSIPPTDQPILSINGAASDESITISEVGTGVIPVDVFGVAAVSAYTPSISNTVLFKFTQHTSDVLYDSCDNEELTCDHQDAANVVFVANPVENTILFTLSGIASTKEIATYSYIGVGVESIFGSYQSVKFGSSEIGFGTIFINSSSIEKDKNAYNGSGGLFVLSGSSKVYSVQTPKSTILIKINGYATTKIELEYTVVGIGEINLSGTSSTRKISTYPQIGFGSITLSGELLHPNIIFLPAYKAVGSINIISSSDDSLVKNYKNTSGSLFGFSSGFESFSKSTYIGFGTIYIQEISGTTVNNPFQIPRTYVVII